MEKLRLLSQDKDTLKLLRDYFFETMKDQIVKKAFKKEDVSGYAEARSVIENALDEIDKMTERQTWRSVLARAP